MSPGNIWIPLRNPWWKTRWRTSNSKTFLTNLWGRAVLRRTVSSTSPTRDTAGPSPSAFSTGHRPPSSISASWFPPARWSSRSRMYRCWWSKTTFWEGTNDCRGWIRRSLFSKLDLPENCIYQFRLAFEKTQAKGSFKVMEEDVAELLDADIVLPESSVKPGLKIPATVYSVFGKGRKFRGPVVLG